MVRWKAIVSACLLCFAIQQVYASALITNIYHVKHAPNVYTVLDTTFCPFISYFTFKEDSTLTIEKEYDKSSYRLNKYILLLVDYVNELDTVVQLNFYSNKNRYQFVGEVENVQNNIVTYRTATQIQSDKQFFSITLLPKQTIHACLLYQPISFKDYYFKRNANDLYLHTIKYHFPVFTPFIYKRNIGYSIQYFFLLGVIFIMLVFYLLAYWYLKDKIYLYYSYYLLFTFLQVLYMVQYEISRNMVMFNFIGNSGFDEATKGLMIYFYAQFYRQVFNITKKDTVLHYSTELLKITCLLYVAIIIIAYTFHAGWYPEIILYKVYRLPVFVFSTIALLSSFRVKDISYFQKIILSGSLVYMFFNLLSTIQKTDFIFNDLFIQVNTLYLGILFELIFFSVALIIRIKDSFLASEALKDKLIVELRQNEEFMANENIILENRVKDRIEQVEQQNILIEEQKRNVLIQSFEKEKAEIQMQALSAQMNPHFIFNCMNSIQHAIIINDTEKASVMLNDFASLIRMVLEHSAQAKISLENEIKILETYLKLEQLRTSYSFDYEISIAGDIVKDFVEIPTMLLQPFLENAIWHGFKEIRYKGIIHISFSLQNEMVYCTITDNGTGRSNATKDTFTITKKSLAISIIQNKINLINQTLEHHKASLNIIDLYNDQQQPAGTKVIVALPVV